MANLLPTVERAHARTERYKRLGIYALLGLLVTGVLGIMLTLPSFFVVKGRERALRSQLDAVTKLIELKQGSVAGVALADTKTRIALLDATLTTPSAHDVFRDIIARVPAGISISHYTFVRTGDAVTATLTGQADSRENLLAFGDALRQAGAFQSVDIPVNSLARSANVPFALTLVLEEKNNTRALQ